MPHAAVTVGGSVSVVSGSTIASRGRSDGCEIPVFMWSASTSMTQTGVASAPVPAVVGSATSGFSGRVGASARPIGLLR